MPSLRSLRQQIMQLAEERATKRVGKHERIIEILEQLQLSFDEPLPPSWRRKEQLLQAEGKCFDLVWYNRHQIWNEKLQSGEAKLIDNGEDRGKDPFGLRIHRGVWEGAERAARNKEEQYGLSELGPWNDFEWGMINGKLSALRWVLGDDWDMLDT